MRGAWLRFVLCALAAAMWSSSVGVARATDWDPSKLITPPLRPIQNITPTRKLLRNGIIVYLLEDHTLPQVRGVAYTRSTPVWIPDSKVGLGSITGEVMRSGGTVRHPGDALDDRLGAIGASITSGLDGGSIANAGFQTLSDNAAEVVGLWCDVMRRPSFPDDKIELSKVGHRRAIAERNDELFDVLSRVMRTAVYGKQGVWSRIPEYATVENVTRGDCIELHRKVFDPSHMVIAVFGDFNSQTMLKQLDQQLGDWKGSGTLAPPAPPVPASAEPRLVFAPKDDVTQSGIIVAHVGFRADDPDYPAMDVYQTALGGGFQSRLVNKIRTERGLAYATGATTGEDYLKPGLFLAYSLTQSESTMTALGLLRDEVRRSVSEPFSDEEIRLARNSVENAFVFRFEDPADILFRAAYYDLAGYPQDFLQRYQRGVQAVTSASVSEAARRKIHPDQLVTVIVGKESEFDKPLASMGQRVERVDIAIPSLPAKQPEGQATPEQLARGKAWLASAAGLSGGRAAWQAVHSIHLESQDVVTMEGQSIKMLTELSWNFPNRLLSVQHLPFGDSKIGFDGAIAWGAFGKQVHEDQGIARDIGAEWQRSLFHLFGQPDDVTVRADDAPYTLEGVVYRVGHAKTRATTPITLYFAPDGTLARVEYAGPGPRGETQLTDVLADWQSVGALRYPHQRAVLIEGKPYLQSKLKTLKLNPPLADSLFKKPGS